MAYDAMSKCYDWKVVLVDGVVDSLCGDVVVRVTESFVVVVDDDVLLVMHRDEEGVHVFARSRSVGASVDSASNGSTLITVGDEVIEVQYCEHGPCCIAKHRKCE